MRTKAFIRSHEEGFISSVVEERNDDRSAYFAPEYVVAKRGLLGDRDRMVVASGVEGIVLKIVVDRTVERIGSILRNLIDVDTQRVSILRCIVAVPYLLRAKCIGVDGHGNSRTKIVHDANTVERDALIDATGSTAVESVAGRQTGKRCSTFSDVR